MEKKIRILLLALSLPVLLFGQAEFDSGAQPERAVMHQKRDFTVFLSAAHLGVNEPYNATLAGGMKIRMFLGERFSFDSGFLFGKDHGQFGVGTLGIPLWLLGFDFSFVGSDPLLVILLFGSLMLLSAEHIAYHIPAGNRMDISPYVSFLRIKDFGNLDESVSPDGYQSPACFALGLEINSYFKRFVIAPYVDYNVAYQGEPKGFNFGLNVGYYFPTRR